MSDDDDKKIPSALDKAYEKTEDEDPKESIRLNDEHLEDAMERLRQNLREGVTLPKLYVPESPSPQVGDRRCSPIDCEGRSEIWDGTAWILEWCWDKFRVQHLMLEIERRPQGVFKEVDDYNFKGSPYCRCDKCCYARRHLLAELKDQSCPNN